MGTLKESFRRRSRRVRRTLRRAANGPRAVGVPLLQAYLCSGDRRRLGQDRGGRLDAGQGPQGRVAKGSDLAAAQAVGKLVAERAIQAGVKDVVFDRGGYLYHGRVKALAEAAREAGLNF